MSKFKHYSQSQAQLLPPSLDDFVDRDHIARLINQVVDEMNLSFIENTYSDNGQKAYHPKMLFKVLVYSYTVGLRSSRKIADKLREDIVFMWLSGRQTPDFRTISDFRKDRLGGIKDAFVQILSLCQELGMIKIGKVCLDGTKARASANGNRMQYRKTLEKRRSAIEAQVQDILDEAEEIDQEEEELLGDNTEHRTGVDIKEVKKKLAKMNRRKETLGRKKKKLKAKKHDINGKLRKMRKDRNSYSSTDKDATLMLMKEKYIAPGYNIQFATEHQVILAYHLTSDRTDYRSLKPMIKEIETNTREKPKILIADAGYSKKTNYRYLKNSSIAAFIPYCSFNREMVERNKGIYQPPKKIDKEYERYKFRQKQRLVSRRGKELMKRRREDVEPVIGDIKQNMKFRTFHLRGKPKCLTELSLVSIGHNLKKIKSHLKKQAKWDDGLLKGIELGTTLGYRST